mgnify:CR=1 FL=1
MNANEIIVGKDYILKIAHNEVKVKVLSNVGHSWIVKTAGGKVMPVQNADRFIRQIVPADVVPLQASEAEGTETPATPPEAETAATAATMPPEPATIPTSATPATEATEPEKKLTMLDAAAQVLKTAGHPMTIKEILDAMQTSGFWAPGKGLTPDRTLISGIGVETRRKPNPRFRKTAPGKFEYAG